MDQFKGTQGKWSKIRDYAGAYDIVIKERGEVTGIAHVDPYWTGLPKTQNRANAQLIATAPELLKALQDVTSAYKETINSEYGNVKDWDNCGISEIEYADKVIKKAFGS